MRSVKKILKDKKEIEDIKGLVQVYEEISASKIQKVRDEILTSRDFFERLSLLSKEVGADLEASGLGASGEAFVFISSQTGLYGDIVDRIFVSFSAFLKSNPTADVYVLGKLGDSLMKSFLPKVKYQYFDLQDEELTDEKLREVIKSLVQYKKINLFYGKFKNIVVQESSTSSISGRVLKEVQDQKVFDEKLNYLYEPEVNSVAKVFSEEIAGLLFNGTLEESRLAKLASRMMYLDEALENVDKRLMKISLERVKAIKRKNERKQLTSFAGIMNT